MDEENEEDQVCIHRWQQQKKGKRGLAAAEWETGSVSEWWPLVAWVIPIRKASEGEEGMPWKRKSIIMADTKALLQPIPMFVSTLVPYNL